MALAERAQARPTKCTATSATEHGGAGAARTCNAAPHRVLIVSAPGAPAVASAGLLTGCC
jgi:hypothetical protein